VKPVGWPPPYRYGLLIQDLSLAGSVFWTTYAFACGGFDVKFWINLVGTATVLGFKYLTYRTLTRELERRRFIERMRDQ
jgi:hypothetical protein